MIAHGSRHISHDIGHGTVAQWTGMDYRAKVTDYILNVKGSREEADDNTVTELVGANTYQISNKLSVLYLHVSAKPEQWRPGMDPGAWGLDFKCYPIGTGDRECVVIPLKNGIGLTPYCVCLQCVTAIALRAEREQKNIGEEIRRLLTVPMTIMTRNVVYW